MNQLTLEFSNREDLDLLLSFAKRLNAFVISVKLSEPASSVINTRRAMLQKAANDPLFLADIAEITEDFKHIDTELL
jgi:hypothetical protein